MPKESCEVFTAGFNVTVISLLYSPVTQMLQHGPFLHFMAFVKGLFLLFHLFLNYIDMNFSINSHPLPDLQTFMHINICACQPS